MIFKAPKGTAASLFQWKQASEGTQLVKHTYPISVRLFLRLASVFPLPLAVPVRQWDDFPYKGL